jgi:inorganic pyrophosphatase
MEFDVLIEIPRGSRNKYEVEQLEPGKSVEGAAWADRAAAEAEVEASRRRLRETQARSEK